MEIPSFLIDKPDGVLMMIKVQPKSSHNSIEEVLGNELKIKVTAPPVESAANTELIRYLSKILDRPRRDIELLKGSTSKHKTFKILGVNAAFAAEKLLAAMKK
ncbi:MAG: DUF167 domain-containing protein [Verrucomicrobia bacterium]|nr:DUF167 domain-containing protein [Verrucomicrobiota bacterium]MCF7709360.1 DUF167 domain-containing protein [Verrucomicrobiota bacterium]